MRLTRAAVAVFLVAGVLAACGGSGSQVRASNAEARNFWTRSYGSDAGQLRAGVTAVGLAADPATGGYWILTSTGGVDSFHAPWHGSLAGKIPAGITVRVIAAGLRGGYRILTSGGGAVPADLAGRVWNVIPTHRRVVALTFDIGPTNGVKSILATLRRDHVRATFFLVGGTVKKFKATAGAIAAAGERVANHSNRHPHFTRVTDARIRAELRSARTEIESVTGRDAWPWFRFPYGDYNAHAIGRQLGRLRPDRLDGRHARVDGHLRWHHRANGRGPRSRASPAGRDRAHARRFGLW